MKYQAIGAAIMNEIITRITKSLDNNRHTLNTLAPNTFLTPISLVRCSATKDASPKIPRQEMKIARKAKKVESLPISDSDSNVCATNSSAKWYSNGTDGFNLVKTAPILLIALATPTSGLILILITG